MAPDATTIAGLLATAALAHSEDVIVFRVERLTGDAPEHHPDCWMDLPSPRGEAKWEDDELVARKLRAGWRCAATPTAFHRWWPDKDLQYVLTRPENEWGYRPREPHAVRILAVPKSSAVVLSLQAVIDRKSAKVVHEWVGV